MKSTKTRKIKDQAHIQEGNSNIERCQLGSSRDVQSVQGWRSAKWRQEVISWKKLPDTGVEGQQQQAEMSVSEAKLASRREDRHVLRMMTRV
mmetsp:Transcript_60181/g.127487  ORF Transcript_60181/g.127487 Transcript_60181/m.127487 type:complete len:92 (+) Transcript_60181:142-417(+)|eukprot:CAMPEP_0194756038 /NCGR_PEP_ID=MMETSP0323_2-20130528/9808_1 /TAXON_ID=2866 ORGANISM="Crypthecodinium cohnii, Strain Seligo" /NCGR_SAMPLE_ID=MMETSP0323_2 /ASSEMBLY_ACC=CAM_ASM_000346 /LENGTH=91 /DNA_ID=CAMNT_0039675371 /DNA_START=142 /DNA_END=417 /DNA_ORIENTATION=-